MASTKLFLCLSLLSILPPPTLSAPGKSNLFVEYIGSQFTGIKFTDVPINPNVNLHFILSFALDYTTTSSSPSTTNGRFNIFWDNENLSSSAIAAIKRTNRNVKVEVSLGGNAVEDEEAFFSPSSIDSWVSNAVTTLTPIIKENNLDGIDIDYEHFKADPNTFAECIGQLITTLKDNGVISFASIAPFDDEKVQGHYQALWKRYGSVIDYVNFQFYAYDAGITVKQYLSFFDEQSKNYDGKKLLASFSTASDSGGLSPLDGGFFRACNILRKEGMLIGIFVWSADTSMGDAFQNEKQSQLLLS